MLLFEKEFKPLLAGKGDLLSIKFPVAVSPKIDGIRVLVINGEALSRTLKPIRNKGISETLAGIPYLLDGEIVAAGGNFQESTHAVMSADAEDAWEYHVFDLIDPTKPYSQRYQNLTELFKTTTLPPQVKLLENVYLYEREAVEQLHAQHIADGFEGTMLRDPAGRYKYGRSTTREGILLKLKQFEDAEAIIVGFEELMHNDNEATTNALGHTERSSHKDNKRASGKLGAFVVELATDRSIKFRIGTGLTDEQRIEYWLKQEELIGDLVKFKYFAFGVKEAPRHPVFLGFRDERDMG